MNRKTKEMIANNGLSEKPVYTEEDLKILAERLMFHKKNPKAWNIIKQLQAIDFNPFLFEAWAEQTNDEYDYKAILFESSQDNLPLLINEQMDFMEDVVFQWRLERNK